MIIYTDIFKNYREDHLRDVHFYQKNQMLLVQAFVTDESKHFFFDLYVSYNNVQNNPVCDKGSGSLLAFFLQIRTYKCSSGS